MDTSSYDAKIQAAASDKETLWSQVEAACLEYIQVCARFFGGDFQNQVESAITDQSTITQNLGVVRLGELKRELKQLVGNLPEIVFGSLNRPGLWEPRSTS